MSLDEYRGIWKEQETSDEVEPTGEELMSRVKERSEEYDRKIFWRDAREIGASVLVAGFFGWEAATAEHLLARVGAAIVVAGALLIIWRLRRARRNGDEELAGRPVAERLRAEIEKVEVQIRLLESILWWYLAPLVGGLALMVAAGGLEGWFDPAYLAAVVAGAGLVWHLNQRAVRRSLRPRRRELAELLDEVEASGAGGEEDVDPRRVIRR